MKEWEREERRLARRRGGALNAGSGSGWRRRNDVRESSVLWEQKTTGKRQYTIKEDDWEKLRTHALSEGRIPALHITLGAKKRRLVVIEEDDFDEGHPPDRSQTTQRHVSSKRHPAAQDRASRHAPDEAGRTT